MAIINEGMKKMIEENAMGLATIGNDGKPHNVAVGYAKVISGDELLLTNNYLNETIENIRENNNIALVVWNKNWKEECIGYELKGTALYFNEGKWIEFIKKIPINKGEPCKGAILIKINNVKVLS
jgi:predicted pyridoxine 5'-phosphate oxidase superfamily flavin-nucleotide-binding protein